MGNLLTKAMGKALTKPVRKVLDIYILPTPIGHLCDIT